MSFLRKVHDERNRQIRLGYTPEHDRVLGTRHLLKWAWRYFLKRKFVKAAALLIAVRDLQHRSDWTGVSTSIAHSGIRARSPEEASEIFEMMYGHKPEKLFKVN